MSYDVLTGDNRKVLRTLAPGTIRCCVTSPPYIRQRVYGPDKREIGRELSPKVYARTLVGVFRLVRDAMADDAVLWLNLGEKWAAGGMGWGKMADRRNGWKKSMDGSLGLRNPPPGYKRKDQLLAPFIVADALRRDGWYLRQTIIWESPVAREPPREDRPSQNHEYLFQLAKSHTCCVRDPGEPWFHTSVWHISPVSDDDHDAPMPPELARRCILASTKAGDGVLDPFCGTGNVLRVAHDLARHAVGIDIYKANTDVALARLESDHALFRPPLEQVLLPLE